MNEAVGAFIVCAVLMTLAGATGWFERVMNKIPMALASALLAGVLARFGLEAFVAAQTRCRWCSLMLGTYLVGKRLLPRYAVPLTLLVAIAFVAARGELAWGAVHFSVAMPVFTMPRLQLAGRGQPGIAAVRGDDGVAESSGRCSHPGGGL